ncbi:MAG: DUF4294 domain-containing protein [Bacteroidales bacterium]|nr:DUF4294 domain-containing protein [Bacteroidales bacterium]MDD3430411.1 DUF4294 domain-containing protein [Bacteroidales bacterium]MDD4361072.1 DUF4294 domain-containing protein [Bacteroidales bacterium]MDD4429882.1 DUF4294 domain-containing protein [Bacteroidales bacterium]
MRYLLFTLLILLSINTQAQIDEGINRQIPVQPPQLMPAQVESGDTVLLVNLSPVYVYPGLIFKNKREERYYWRLVRDVKLCLPLAGIVSSTLIETAEYMETLPDDKAREKHLKQMQRDLIRDYEPTLRKMSYSQGKILLKLIVRECDSSPYDIIAAYMGYFAANFWQGVARLFTADLKTDYNPADDQTDQLIERIVIMVEQGML